MKRQEILDRAKPILFNTEMVRAILDGRKTVTRRRVKYKYSNTEMKMRTDKYGSRLIEIQKNIEGETFGKNPDGTTWHKLLGYIEPMPPYKKGDILYVRETWGISNLDYDDKVVYIVYKASENEKDEGCRAARLPNDKFEKLDDSMAENSSDWRPSIHMPKEAARIFLRVTDVRVERLQAITEEQARTEGVGDPYHYQPPEWYDHHGLANNYLRDAFAGLWNSTIKKSDIDRYGWDANPFVWVIKFEMVEVE